MVPPSTVIFALISLPLAALAARHNLRQENQTLTILDPVCLSIASTISTASAVYYPGVFLSNHAPKFLNVHFPCRLGQLHYTQGIHHWASSSTQLAKCVVEPGTAADVGVIVSYIISSVFVLAPY